MSRLPSLSIHSPCLQRGFTCSRAMRCASVSYRAPTSLLCGRRTAKGLQSASAATRERCTPVGPRRSVPVVQHPFQHEVPPSSAHHSPRVFRRITVTFVDRDGERFVVKAPVGENLLEVAHENNVDLEGACEGSLACSTCHVIVEDRNMYDKIPVRRHCDAPETRTT